MINPLRVITRIKLGDVKSSCCNGIPPEELDESKQEEEIKPKPKNKKLSNKK